MALSWTWPALLQLAPRSHTAATPPSCRLHAFNPPNPHDVLTAELGPSLAAWVSSGVSSRLLYQVRLCRDPHAHSMGSRMARMVSFHHGLPDTLHPQGQARRELPQGRAVLSAALVPARLRWTYEQQLAARLR